MHVTVAEARLASRDVAAWFDS